MAAPEMAAAAAPVEERKCDPSASGDRLGSLRLTEEGFVLALAALAYLVVSLVGSLC